MLIYDAPVWRMPINMSLALSKCHFFDAETVASSSTVDGVHLDRDQHARLGNALAEVVQPILTSVGTRDFNPESVL